MADVESAHLGQLLTRLWEAARDRMIAHGQRPLAIKDIAESVGASRGAVYLWFNGQRQPRPAALEKIAHLFGGDDQERREIHSEFLKALEAQGRRPESAPPPAFLTSSGIAEREKYAADLWVLKWQKRFRSGSDAFLFDELAKIFEATDRSSYPRFHYVFPSPQVADEVAELRSKFSYDMNRRREDLMAQRSFVDLDEQLLKKFPGLMPEQLRNVVCRHELDSLADVLYLGIPRAEMIAYFMIEYNADGYDRYKRWVDIFVEIEAKTDFSIDNSVDELKAEGPLTYWVALPKELSEQMRSNWKVLLDLTHNDGIDVDLRGAA